MSEALEGDVYVREDWVPPADWRSTISSLCRFYLATGAMDGISAPVTGV